MLSAFHQACMHTCTISTSVPWVPMKNRFMSWCLQLSVETLQLYTRQVHGWCGKTVRCCAPHLPASMFAWCLIAVLRRNAGTGMAQEPLWTRITDLKCGLEYRGRARNKKSTKTLWSLGYESRHAPLWAFWLCWVPALTYWQQQEHFDFAERILTRWQQQQPKHHCAQRQQSACLCRFVHFAIVHTHSGPRSSMWSSPREKALNSRTTAALFNPKTSMLIQKRLGTVKLRFYSVETF